MDCPLCRGVKLLMADRQGVEIDYCPECRGIWLDRGELEKLIELSTSDQREREVRVSRREASRRGRDTRDRDDLEYERRRPKKRESWLGEILDIFD